MSVRAQRIGGNFAVLLAGQVVGRLLAFTVVIHLARVLSIHGFGMIVFANGALLYLGLSADGGITRLGPLEVARGTFPVPTLVRSCLTMRLILTALTLVVIAPMLWFAPTTGVTKVVLLMYALSLFASALDVSWVFLGTESVRPVVVADITSQAIQTAGAFILIRTPEHVLRMSLVFLFAQMVSSALLLIIFIRRFGRLRLGLDLVLVKQLVPRALPLIGSNAVGLITSNFDLVLLGLWIGSGATAFYGAAYRVVWMPTIVITTLYMALRPTLARAGLDGFDTVASLFGRVMRIVTAAGVGVAVAGILLATPLISGLYGSGYHYAVRPLQILLIAFVLVAISRSYRLLLVAFHHQVVEFRIMLTAAVLNIVLNLTLIPPLGLPGAALATLASEAVVLIAMSLATRRLVGGVPVAGSVLVRPLLCAVPLAALLVLTPHLSLPVRGAAGAILYTIVLVVARAVEVTDVSIIYNSLLHTPSTLIRVRRRPREVVAVSRVDGTHLS